MLFLKVFFILALIAVAFIVGWSVGLGTITIEYRDWKETDGWLVRPFKHMYCGAVYGHIYEKVYGKDTPEAGGWEGTRCKRCGKLHVQKTGKRKDTFVWYTEVEDVNDEH